ncbi:MAG: hypothetical protein JWN40_2261 [Phycisphaerales bacterium]|nr:hypothetical protein [Phycisphaerales bacterium]
MSFPSPEPPEQPASTPIRKARPTVRGPKLSEEEVAAAFANTATQYGPILKLKDAAAIVGVATGTLKRWASEGRFPRSAKRGKPLLFWPDRFVAEVMR